MITSEHNNIQNVFFILKDSSPGENQTTWFAYGAGDTRKNPMWCVENELERRIE